MKAICSVGESTKAAKVGYIGEKGIGFKSVFKVAQQVHIYSHPFYFKFDKRQELGMITPIWVSDDEKLYTANENSQTTILLLPAAGETFTKIWSNFKAIAPTLLLFLRQLKKLELRISETPPTRKILTSSTYEDGKFAKLRVEDDSAHPKLREYRYRLFRRTTKISEN